MDIDVGPVDPSVLYEQDLHVSSAVWEGQERGLLRCQEHTSLLHQWKLTDEQVKLVDKAGFGYFRRIGPMSLNNSLISALVERWRRETNTFHLSLGEMTITMDEVALVLGLEIDGEPVVGAKVGDEAALDICGRLLGKVPSAANKEVNCSRVKLNWLKKTFSECPEDASAEQVKCHTRAYLLYLIGSTIFATTDGDKVSVKYLPLFEDFDKAGRYAWGAAALACLYRALGNASLKSQSNICGCLTLLQCWSYFHLDVGRPEAYEVCFPLALLWKGKGSRSKTDLTEYRRELDDLDPSKITWCPYEKLENIIPQHIKAKLVLGRSRTTLVCFEKIELHFPDRCLRQFGKCQPIPQKVKRRDRKNRRLDDLDTSMSLACEEWAERRDNIMDSPAGGCVDEGAYMEWYARISITKLYREAFLETQVMNMIACMRESEEAAAGISLEKLAPVEREVVESVKDTLANYLTFGGWQEAAINSGNGYGKRRRRNEQTPANGNDISPVFLDKET
ncbi:PREDICTED: serine/threonine-protein phosphatase 7 long form homolog [Tarenaya hassleriana]|uniref:serine/threonine-protein phosphatase 7 long form homolog n=1 Tax=Tarenaya hassleriana TaxID=28532 RepID=UPI00053C9A21|nr:PREDICTED: serine/threonine-protein phosphatase 7 long form homolog [Tarenaya hassleriana]